MRYILFILVLIVIYGCQEDAKYKTSDSLKYNRQLFILKSKNKDSINNQTINSFKFGMTENEVSSLKDSLIQKEILEKYSDKITIYDPNEVLKGNENIIKPIEGRIRFDYEKNKLNKITIDIGKNDFKNAVNIYTSIFSKPDLYFKAGKYDTKYTWIIGTQEITINYFYGSPKITHYDYISVSPEELQKRREELNRREYVGNNEYDGSVEQVVDYLKENLKDPRSYESISWSKVMHKNGYYMVRHKYRAKNSFGGFAVENKIFYINLYGEIYKIEDFNN